MLDTGILGPKLKQKDRLISPYLTTSVVLELDFGLMVFPAGSPLPSGCNASETALTSVKLVNLEWQSLPRVPQFPCIG